MTLVVDSSAIVPLAMLDEDRDYAVHVVRQMANQDALVPALFWYEIRNVLVVAQWRGRIDASTVDDFRRELSRLPIQLETTFNDEVVATAQWHNLSVYDAAYLEMAHRRGASVATADRKLGEAADASGVEWLKR